MSESMKCRIIVLRVADADPDDVPEGSALDRCRTCFHDVWVSLQARVYMTKNPAAELRCSRCYAENPPGPGTMFEAVPGAIEAARAHLARLKTKPRPKA